MASLLVSTWTKFLLLVLSQWPWPNWDCAVQGMWQCQAQGCGVLLLYHSCPTAPGQASWISTDQGVGNHVRMAFWAGENLEEIGLWEDKWICPLPCCFVLNDYHKTQIASHPKSMLLQAFTGSIPSNAKSCWSCERNGAGWGRAERVFWVWEFKFFSLSAGNPDGNSGSSGCRVRAHVDITPPEYTSTGELPWT